MTMFKHRLLRRMVRRCWPLLAYAILLLAPEGVFAQTVAVQSTLTDGSGGAVGGKLFLHFVLNNCGANIPINSATSAIVKRSFDVVAASNGVATGTVVPNDLIKCGNVVSTQWAVSVMSSENSPITEAQTYFICSSSAVGFTCAQPSAGATFDIATAQPASLSPPSPGFIPLFDNPVQTQNVVQPGGTQLNFGGTINFCSATVLCGGGSGSAAITVNNGSVLPFPVNLQNGLNTTATNPTGSNVQYNVANATNSVLGVLKLTGDFGGSATAPTVVNGSNITNSSIPNNGLLHPSLTVTAVSPLSGGGSVALGSSVSVTLASCSSVGQAWIWNGSAWACASSSGLPSAQIGDVIRFNVNGDGLWDAVNYAQSVVAVYAINQSSTLQASGALGVAGPTITGSTSDANPTATSQSGKIISAAATASTNTVLAYHFGENGSSSLLGMEAFYRWSSKFAAGNTTNVRYWMGLGCVHTAGTGNNGTAIGGTTAYATDTPNKSTIGFLYSAGTASNHWQLVTDTAGGSQTNVDSGVTEDTNPHIFEMTTNSTGTAVTFWIDSVNVGTISTNLPPPANNQDSWGDLFFTGDNKNTNTAISATFYWAQMSLK